MALRDKLQILVDAGDISSAITSDIVKLAATGTNPGVASEGQYINVEVDTVIGGTTPDVVINLQSSATVGGTYADANPHIEVALDEDTPIGQPVSYLIPASVLQFVKAEVTITGTSPTGNVSVWIGQREGPRG